MDLTENISNSGSHRKFGSHTKYVRISQAILHSKAQAWCQYETQEYRHERPDIQDSHRIFKKVEVFYSKLCQTLPNIGANVRNLAFCFNRFGRLAKFAKRPNGRNFGQRLSNKVNRSKINEPKLLKRPNCIRSDKIDQTNGSNIRIEPRQMPNGCVKTTMQSSELSIEHKRLDSAGPWLHSPCIT